MKEFSFKKDYPSGENTLWVFTKNDTLILGIVEGITSYNIKLKKEDIDEIIAVLKLAKKKLS